MSEIELKPCPFCGGKANLVKTTFAFYVECEYQECYAWYPSFRETTESQAVNVWNIRIERGADVNG